MILIRADGNKTIGIGHIMRCMTLADSFRRAGEDVIFVTADSVLSGMIETRGFEIRVLNSDFTRMEDEIPKLDKIITRIRPSFVLVDSYYVTADYLRHLQSLTRVVYIDDLAAFAYPADVLVNYNIYGAFMGYEDLYARGGVKLPALLLGPEYVPLRSMYSDVPARIQNEVCRDVLVSTGGADPLHLALGVVRRIKVSEALKDLHFHILIGVVNPDRDEILSESEDSANITTYYNVSDMRSLILSCDVVVSAAGSTMYEICACGVPMISYVSADNQIDGDRAFQKYGLSISCGDLRVPPDPAAVIEGSLTGLVNNYDLRVRMGRKMQSVIDGAGADRVAKRVMEQL